jgi:hypothetical protein
MEYIIKDFIDANWRAFLHHCKDHGMEDENEIDEEVKKVLEVD